MRGPTDGEILDAFAWVGDEEVFLVMMRTSLTCAHRYALVFASPWTMSTASDWSGCEDLFYAGRVLEERQEVFACKRCGASCAMTHERPIDSPRWRDGGHAFVNR